MLSILLLRILVRYLYIVVLIYTEPGSTGTVFWNMMFVVSSIPIAFATVYEERAFGQQVCFNEVAPYE